MAKSSKIHDAERSLHDAGHHSADHHPQRQQPSHHSGGRHTYAYLGATIIRHRPGQAKDTNLGYETFLNGILVSNIVIVEPTAAPSIVPTDEASTPAATTTPLTRVIPLIHRQSE
jgi:hypothetical protein